MRLFVLMFGILIPLFGQPGFNPSFPDQVRTYLALTAEQIAKIEAQNEEFARWSAERSQRMFAVQLEIAIETARSPLDPAALGVRYAEVEAIRREIAEREKQLLPANVAVLTPAQVTKLKALEEAMKLVSTGSEAQSVRLLPCADNEFARLMLGSVTPAIPNPFFGLVSGAACVQTTPFTISRVRP